MRNPTLHFDLITLFVGVSSIIVHYRRHDGRTGAE